MTGERVSGVDNDSYIDDNFLKIGSLSSDCSIYTNPNTNIDVQNYPQITLAPNPFQEKSILNIPLENQEHIQIYIYDQIGKLQRTHHNVHPPNFILHKENLQRGVYFMKVINQNQLIEIIKFEIY